MIIGEIQQNSDFFVMLIKSRTRGRIDKLEYTNTILQKIHI